VSEITKKCYGENININKEERKILEIKEVFKLFLSIVNSFK